MKNLIAALLILAFASPFLFGQHIPLNNSQVNEDLSYLLLSGGKSYNDFRYPFERRFFLQSLREMEGVKGLAGKYVDYHLKDARLLSVNREDEQLEFFRLNDKYRYNLFNYVNKKFTVFLNPVYGVKNYSLQDDELLRTFSGISFLGTIYDNIGFSFSYRDNNESGGNTRKLRAFSRFPGVRYITGGDYSEVTTTLSYAWSWGHISASKNTIELGPGKGGKIILSDKAPSFPYFELGISPASWLDFTYIHGSLNSGIADSSTLRHKPPFRDGKERFDYESFEKYIALHYITLKPLEHLYVTLGESMVYSYKLKPIYLMPLMFFRLADHYKSYGGSGDNAQFWGNISYFIPELKTELYGSLYIDEIDLGMTLAGNDSADQHIAYTVGVSKADLLWDYNRFTIEYSRVNPFAYKNANEVESYSSSGYEMGHWIGSNADHLYLEYLQYAFIRGLKFKFYADIIRKGSAEEYGITYNEDKKFLSGKTTYITQVGFFAGYEFIHDLNFEIEYIYREVGGSARKDLRLVPGKYNDLIVTARYGL